MLTDELKSLYLDCPAWQPEVNVDDFIVAIGVKQSNSVYHVAEVKKKEFPEKRINRYYVKVFKSDLLTLLKRDKTQALFLVKWHKREKSKK